MIPTVTLNNGIEMPRIGYGVFRMKDPEAGIRSSPL